MRLVRGCAPTRVHADRAAADPMQLPDDQWIRAQLAELGEILRSELSAVTPVLRTILGKVIAEEVKIPG
jgi:hypothetical protein